MNFTPTTYEREDGRAAAVRINSDVWMIRAANGNHFWDRKNQKWEMAFYGKNLRSNRNFHFSEEEAKIFLQYCDIFVKI